MRGIKPARESMTKAAWGIRGSIPIVGAMAVVVLMAMAPVASATSASAIVMDAKKIITNDSVVQGCAKSKVVKPSLSLTTGLGKFFVSGQSKTCPASSGGSTQISESVGQVQLGVTEGLKLTKPATTVNITWNGSAATSDSATGTYIPSNCPWYNFSGPSVTFFANGSVASGFINYSSSYCEVLSLWEIYAQQLVFDVTTSTYSYGSSAFFFNESGSEYQNTTETINYTNASYWSSNYSYHSAGNFSFGTGGTGNASLSGSTLISGSWAKGDRLLIESYFTVYTVTEVYFANHAVAKVLVNASTSGNHVDLKGITVS
jgi:hypothetical protein